MRNKGQIKKGDRVFCIKNCQNLFYKGKLYTIHFASDYSVSVSLGQDRNPYLTFSLYSESYHKRQYHQTKRFEEYFITQQQLRKNKLFKIKNGEGNRT